MPISRPGGLKRGPLFDTNIPATEIDKDIFTDQEVEATIAGDDLILMLDVSETPDVIKYMTRSNFVAGLAGSTITVSDNESTDENNLITFVADAGDSTGSHSIEMDGTLHYNPSTGKVTATSFAGALSGNATTATALASGRTIAMTGDVAWTSASFDGSGNVTGAGTIQANAVDYSMLDNNVISSQTEITSGLAAADELLYSDAGVLKKVGLDTLVSKMAGTGLSATSGVLDVSSAYEGDVQAVTAGVGLSGGGTTGSVTLTLDLSELSAVTPTSGDSFSTLDNDGANEQRTTTDALATLFAGAGMTASSAVLNVIAGTGIDVTADAVAVDVSDFMSNGTNNYIVTATGTDAMNAEAQLTFDGDVLAITGTGTAKSNKDILTITNDVNAADMDGTETSILFNQWYYDGSSPAVADAGRISVGTEQDWTSTASTQDSYIAFEAALNGTVTERLRISSDGAIGIGGATYGSSGDVLTSGGSSSAPTWETPTTGDITGVDLTGGTNVNISSETNTTGGAYSSTINLDSSPTLTSSSANEPILTITNTHADATAGFLKFIKDPGSGQGADDDVLGTITFYGTDASNNSPEELARIQSTVVEADHGSEAAAMKFYVAENDATMTAGLQILGQATDNGEIDVTIGAGAASTTIIAGTLTMGSTAALTNGGLVSVANQSNITGLGTVASGTWEATDVGVAHGGTGVSTLLANAVLTGNGTSAIQAETDLLFSSNKLIPTASAHDAAGTTLTVSAGATTAGTSNNQAGGALTFQGGQGKGSGAGGAIIFQVANEAGSGSSLNSLATALTINDDSTITTAGAIELGHASDTTIVRSGSGDITIEGNAVYRAGGTDVAIADGGTGAGTATAGFDALSPMSAEGDILYGGASGTVTKLAKGSDDEVLTLASGVPSWAASSSTTSLTSSSASQPIFSITNTHADATAGYLKFVKDPGSGQGADNDVLGTITFYGTDASNNAAEELARMEAYVIEADHGSEAGGIKFYVAENDATMTAGLQVLGVKDADGEIDVTIGAGAASTTKIAGTLTMGTTAAMTNAGLVSVANQSGITGLGTIATGVWEGTDVGVAHGGTGVSTLLANAVLTGNGTSAIQAESTLLFSSNKLIPTASAHDAGGSVLTVSAGATTAGTSNNQAGGALTFQGGQGKGSGAGGAIIFQVANEGGSGSSLNALATALTINDDSTITTTGAIELGHASDTTLARSGSGDLTIEGNAIYRAGGTDVPVADGGTGQSNLNNLITMGTHTTGNYVATVTAGTGLTSTGATSGESIAHSLSVDAAQTGITSLGTQAANFAVGNGYGVVIGDATQETVSIGDGATDLVPELQVLGTAAADSSMLLAAFSTTATTAGSPIIALAKGGNATLGSHTVVTDGEELGNIIAFGDDGTDLETPAASIQFEVDGTPGSGDMPGRILLNTTADGATAVTEAVRIDASQNSTFAGNVVLADAANVNISAPLLAGTDHTTTGLTAQMLAGGTIAAFDLVCIGTTTGEVIEADASAVGTARVIGIAPAAISDEATGTVLLQGFIRDDTWNWTTGSPLYLSETAGAMTHTAPTTDGAFVQVVGVALEPDVVYFNPSMDIIEHA